MISNIYKKPIILGGVDMSPDSFIANSIRRPDESFIVSRNVAGDPLSRYGDDVWDFSAYSSSHKISSNIYFSIETKRINEDLKWILFCIDRIHEKGMSGFISATTLRQYNYTLRKIGVYCESSGVEVADFFMNPMHISNVIDQCSDGMLVSLYTIIVMLRPLKKVTGIGLNINRQIENAFTEAFRAAEEQKQYPVIPSRVLYALIKIFTKRVEEYLAVSTEIDDFFKWLGLERSAQKGWLRGKVNEYSKETKSETFQNYFLGISEKLHIGHLYSHMSHVQYCCKGLIHIYSGMRDGEAHSLRYSCLREEKDMNGRVLRLIGETTKLVGSRKLVLWVTCKEIEPVVLCLQAISRICYHNMVVRKHASIASLDINEMPLFISMHQSVKKKRVADKIRVRSSVISNTLLNKYLSLNEIESLKIRAEDFDELLLIDPLRDWRGDGYGEGDIWIPTSHQYRRSLAVYSAQSGLISLPALKKQYKHLSAEMTYYYRNNAIEAKRIFKIPERGHIAELLENTMAEAEFLAMVICVYHTKEKLSGSKGKHYQQIKDNSDHIMIKIYESREETIKEYKSGLRSFKETPVGFCEGIKPCELRLTGAFSDCFGCGESTIREDKLNQTIKTQKIFVGSLDDSSPEYRAELSELNKMEDTLKSFK